MISLLTGIVFFICGAILYKFPPKKINSFIGYRTDMAYKNQDTWDEAQKQGGKSMSVFGIVSISIGGILNFILGLDDVVSLNIQMILLIVGSILMIVYDEIKLRRIFNKDGSRK